jgi:hypothetical protein
MNPSFTMGQVATSGNAIQQSTMGNAMQQFRPQFGQQSFSQFSNPYLRNSWNVVENKAPEREMALRNAWNVAANKAPEREAALRNAWTTVENKAPEREAALFNAQNVYANKAPERQAALQSVGYNSFASPYSTGGNYNMASMTSASR